MDNFIKLITKSWSQENTNSLDSLAMQYERLRVYRELLEIVSDSGISEHTLKLWIYFSHLELGMNSLYEIVFFVPTKETTYVDKISNIPPKVIEQLKSVISKYMNNYEDGVFKNLKPLKAKSIKHGILYRGDTIMGNVDDFNADLKEEQLELVMVQSYFRLEPKLIDSTYYSYLYEEYDIAMHTIASHKAFYYHIFGSYNSVDIESDWGDMILDSNIADRIVKGGNFEINLTHFGPFHHIIVKYLINKYLIKATKAIRFFIAYDKTVNENYERLYPKYVNMVLNDAHNVTFMVLKSSNMRDMKPEEVDTFKVIFGYTMPLAPITLPIITSFEKAVLIGRRAENIRNGAKPQVPVKDTDIDFLEIAEREAIAKKLPNMRIVRVLPDNTREELDPNEMLW